MSKFFSMILATMLLLAVAAPAMAQSSSSPGGGGGDGQGEDQDIDDGDETAGGTTPCSTIFIQGTSWGPGTPVTIVRNDPGDQGSNMDGDCENEGDVVNGETGQQGDQNNQLAEAPAAPGITSPGATAGRTLGTTTVQPDGTFAISVTVPADAAEGFSYEIVGKDQSGIDKVVTQELDITPLTDVTPTANQSGVVVWQALVVALLGVIVVLQFLGGPLSFRRRRS